MYCKKCSVSLLDNIKQIRYAKEIYRHGITVDSVDIRCIEINLLRVMFAVEGRL